MAEKVSCENGQWRIPDHLLVGKIIGDGIGIDVTPAAIKVLDAAIAKAFDGVKKIEWVDILIGEVAQKEKGNVMPPEELAKIKDLGLVLKGPLTTPVGGGYRSLNVAIRQHFDLFTCMRPVKWYPGIPSPMKKPELLDVVIFRENSEDVYAGIEWESGSGDAKDIIGMCIAKGKKLRDDSGIGIKPISPFGSKRLVKAAMEHTLKNNRKKLTLVHKGNIMKFTEGAFKEWGYEILRQDYADKVVFEEDWDGKPLPAGKVLVNNRIADAMFQQLLLRPNEYDVIATMNLNGDYLSDAAAAQVGGLGLAPGANMGNQIAVFEATHGTAPKYAGQDKVNPSSVLLSGVMMLRLIGWDAAADLIEKALEKTIDQKRVTYDLHRQMEGATLLKCSEFADAIIENMA